MKKTLIVLLFTIFSLNTFCQETVVFATKSSTPKEKNRSKGLPGFENVIKIAPLSFIIGKIPVYYERKINDFLSVQAGVGITSKHYINDALYADGNISGKSIYKSFKWNDGLTNNSYSDNSAYGGDDRSYKMGYTVSLEPRLYFDTDDGLDGAFIGLGYTKSRYNYISKEVKSNVNNVEYTGGSVKEFDNLSTMMVSFGSQHMYEHLSLEYTAGVGLRSSKGERYIYTNSNTTGKFVTGTGIIDRTALAFDITLRVGYHF